MTSGETLRHVKVLNVLVLRVLITVSSQKFIFIPYESTVYFFFSFFNKTLQLQKNFSDHFSTWKKKVIQNIIDAHFPPSNCTAPQCLCCAVILENTSNTFFIAHLYRGQLLAELHCFPVLLFGVKPLMLALCLKSHPINYIVHYFWGFAILYCQHFLH